MAFPLPPKPSGGAGSGDMLKSVYDTDTNNIVDNSTLLNGDTEATVRNHVPQAHTLASHSTKAHSELTGVGADDHHAQAHTLTSHSTRAHSELTGIGANDHHTQAHKDAHKTGGGDAFVVTDLLDGVGRLKVRYNSGADIGVRRRLNFLPNTGISFTILDQPANEEVTIQPTVTGGGSFSELPLEWLIWITSGITYAMNGHTGAQTSNANALTVIQYVINQNPTGKVHIKAGTYDTSSGTITLARDRMYFIEGEGRNTLLDAGTGVGAAVFTVGTQTGIYVTYHVLADLAGEAENGYFYKCDTGDGVASPWLICRGVVYAGLWPSGGCKYGFKIDTPYRLDWEQVDIFSNTAGAVGLWFTHSLNNFNCGNSHIKSLFIEHDAGATGAIGVLIDATGASNAYFNLVKFDYVDMWTSATSSYGFKFVCTDGAKGWINNIYVDYSDIEGYTYPVHIATRSGAGDSGVAANIYFKNFYMAGTIVLTGGGWDMTIGFEDGTVEYGGVIDISGATNLGTRCLIQRCSGYSLTRGANQAYKYTEVVV